MNQKIEKVQIKDLRDELIEKIQKEIENFEVILLDPNITEEKLPLVASGTLIQIEDKYCILTAKHVTDELKKLEKIGLNLGAFKHCFTINTSDLYVKELDSSFQTATSPDLTVIVLPEDKVGTIKAKKLFWNILKHKEPVLSNSIDWKNGLFILCGVIRDWTKVENSTGQFNKTLNCDCRFMDTGIRKQPYVESGFDYLELSVSYRNRTDLPDTFNGASGGGIWGTWLSRVDSKIDYSSPLLMGVAYEEKRKVNDSRSVIESILGYGWHSIYEQLPKVVNP